MTYSIFKSQILSVLNISNVIEAVSWIVCILVHDQFRYKTVVEYCVKLKRKYLNIQWYNFQ
jgi:hypothetical protein